MPKKIEVSHKTIVFTVFFLIFVWFVYYIRDIILEFFVALVIMAILNPAVRRLSNFKIPRAASIIVIYVFLFTTIGFALAGVIPAVFEQTTKLASGLPGYLDKIGIPSDISGEALKDVATQLLSLPGQILKAGVSIFSNLISIIAVFIFAFYLLLVREKFDDQLSFFLGEENKKRVSKMVDILEERLGGWARGELALMFLVGGLNYIGLSILGIPFALSLAILSGILEIVPYIGPIMAAIPGIIVGLGIGPIPGLAVAALAFLVQQFENYLFVPKVMEKSVGVNPIITLLALAIGFRLAGIIGVILSVPLVITSQVLIKEFVFKS